MSSHGNPRTRAVAALVALSLIWGYNWIVSKAVLDYVSPYDFAAARTLLAALSLFLVIAWRGGSLRPVYPAGLFGLGLLQTTAFIALTLLALETGGAGTTAMLVYLMPFWVLLVANSTGSERLHGMQRLAVPLAFVGLLLLMQPWVVHGTLLSKLFAVAASLAWAGGTLYAKRLRAAHTYELLSLTAWQMLLGALPLVLIALAVHDRPVQWTPYFFFALAYNALLGGAVAWSCWLYVLDKLPAGLASLGTLATPVIGVLAAAIELHEVPGPVETGGMLLISLALALISAQAILEHRRVSASMGQE